MKKCDCLASSYFNNNFKNLAVVFLRKCILKRKQYHRSPQILNSSSDSFLSQPLHVCAMLMKVLTAALPQNTSCWVEHCHHTWAWLRTLIRKSWFTHPSGRLYPPVLYAGFLRSAKLLNLGGILKSSAFESPSCTNWIRISGLDIGTLGV